MKRDMDLIKAILLATEAQPAGEPLRDLSPLGDDRRVVVEHIRLAADDGLIEGSHSSSGEAAVILRLTNAGHDFLAQAREPVLWNKAKETASKAGVGLTVEVMKTLLSQLAMRAITGG